MSGRIFWAETLDWSRFSSDERSGQWYSWKSDILGTPWVSEFQMSLDSVFIHFELREDHVGKIISTAHGLQF